MNEVNGDSVLSETKERCIKLHWGKISTKREKKAFKNIIFYQTNNLSIVIFSRLDCWFNICNFSVLVTTEIQVNLVLENNRWNTSACRPSGMIASRRSFGGK